MAITISDQFITFNNGNKMYTAFLPQGTPTGGGLYVGVFNASWYLFAATATYETTLQWKTTNTSTANTSSTTDGLANTNSMNNAAHPAAYYCKNTMNGSGGFSDWYLPASSELETLAQTQQYLDGFSAAYYWSSTQESTSNAYNRNILANSPGSNDKNYNLSVRPVRRYII